MIILAPKMYFGIQSKVKSLTKAKELLLKKFKIIEHVDPNSGKKQKYFKNKDIQNGNYFNFDFSLDNPVGVTFKDLHDIYNSVPKNLIEGYDACIKAMEKLDPNNEKDDEKYWAINMKSQEYSAFIEKYLNDIRKDAEEDRKDVMKLLEREENGK